MMSQELHAGDTVLFNGQKAIIQCISYDGIRLDIDNGETGWQSQELELHQPNHYTFKEGDKVIIQEPNPIQKKHYPRDWCDEDGKCGIDWWINKECTIKKIYRSKNEVIIYVNENSWVWNECNLKPLKDVSEFCLY